MTEKKDPAKPSAFTTWKSDTTGTPAEVTVKPANPAAEKEKPAPKKKKAAKLTPLGDVHVVWDALANIVTDIAPDAEAAATARDNRLGHRNVVDDKLYVGVLTLDETDEQKVVRAEDESK